MVFEVNVEEVYVSNLEIVVLESSFEDEEDEDCVFVVMLNF